MRYWVSNCDNTHMCVGSTVGPNIFVKICGWSTAQISKELKLQIKSEFKKIPKKIKLINCVGGGSSAYGFWSEFIDYDKKQIELIGVEGGGPKNSKLHAAPLTNGAKLGILHGAAAYVCQNNEGQINETESISKGTRRKILLAIRTKRSAWLVMVCVIRTTQQTDEATNAAV